MQLKASRADSRKKHFGDARRGSEKRSQSTAAEFLFQWYLASKYQFEF